MYIIYIYKPASAGPLLVDHQPLGPLASGQRERGEVHHVQRSLAPLEKLGVADSLFLMPKKTNEILVFSVMDVS